MTYYLIIYPGPIKKIVDRHTYEMATKEENDLIQAPGEWAYKIKERYVYCVEELNAAFVVITSAERQAPTGRDFMVRKSQQ